MPLPLPPDIRVEAIPKGQTLSRMLERGQLDAVLTPRLPEPFVRGSKEVRRLFPDYRRVESEYCRRTGIFPIMHTVVVRQQLYERDPWIAQSLTKALTQAKRLCAATMYDPNAPPYMLPWLHEVIERTRALMGEDWWPYGLEANRAALETSLRYVFAQGLAARGLALDELFAKETLDTMKI